MSHIYPSYNRSELSFERGEGPWLFEKDGRRFFDFGAGIAVNALGHANKRLNAVLDEQANKIWHLSNLYQIPEQEELAQKLCGMSFAEFVFFTNSGAEAVECAIKTARRYHYEQGQPRSKIIALEGCFHGRTMATIALSGASKMIEGFGPLIEGFVQAELTKESLAAKLDTDTAAVIIEPIQGEGGINVIPDDFLQWLREKCDDVGALLIFDEIQCGMGRTGKMFAHEYAGVEPDIMALAKGIGAGFPLGACLANKRTGSTMTPGTHGSTYGGNPLACKIGSEVVDIMNTPDFLSNVNLLAGQLQQRLSSLIDRFPDLFEEIRGQGLMIGLKCKIDGIDFVNAGRQNGVLTVPASNNVIRLLPPLNLTLDELNQGIDLLEKTTEELSKKQ